MSILDATDNSSKVLNRPDSSGLERYRVQLVPISQINPSPENDDIYGEIEHDEQMESLIESIRHRGLEEPIILTEDGFIVSGHRRFYAVKFLRWRFVPCRYKNFRRAGNDSYHSHLAEYNPQRVKSVGSLLKEALLRDKKPEDTYEAIRGHRESSIQVDVDFLSVAGVKNVAKISDKKRPFLEAVQRVVNEVLRRYWPLSIRQIHYNLLNFPPLISSPKRSIKDLEDYRYRNDKASYKALCELLKSARYHGHIPMHCIDDPTRPQLTHGGFNSVSSFVQQEIDGFLTGFHRNRQRDQPRHVELLAEKNTIYGLLDDLAEEYYVPLTSGRGFCTIPVWRNMAARFERSGKDAMTLIVASDYDPEGLELADDAIRSLRDLWRLPVEYHRVAVNREQIEELELSEDFNPAKTSSSRFNTFVERTGSTKTWELEALPPDYLVEHVRAAIEANMDMSLYRRTVDQEKEDAHEIYRIKQTIAGEMRF